MYMYEVFAKGWDYLADEEIFGEQLFNTYDEAVSFIQWCESTNEAAKSEYGPHMDCHVWKFCKEPTRVPAC